MLEQTKQRFWSKTKLALMPRPGMPTPCLEWTASRRDAGKYGQFGIDGKSYSTHRIAWEIENGKIPDGLCVLHRCDNPICVRPDHLFVGTNSDNSADMVAKGRQNTPHGPRHGTHTHPESHARGSEHPNAKLNETTVVRIFALRSSGRTQQAIADEFGVSQSLIHRVLFGKRWAHVHTESA